MDFSRFAALAGDWTGTNRLWLAPGEPVRESATSASCALVAGSGFARIGYTWSEGGQEHDGLLVVRLAGEPEAVDMVWVDSFHMSRSFMVCAGEETADDGSVSALGSYAAPPGPDWGWRIVLHADARDRFRIVMYNIPPAGEPELAVEATYDRSA